MDTVIHIMYTLFLKWGFPLITYKGKVYFTDKTPTKRLVIEGFSNSEAMNFLNTYAIINKKRELIYYSIAKTLILHGNRLDIKMSDETIKILIKNWRGGLITAEEVLEYIEKLLLLREED